MKQDARMSNLGAMSPYICVETSWTYRAVVAQVHVVMTLSLGLTAAESSRRPERSVISIESFMAEELSTTRLVDFSHI